MIRFQADADLNQAIITGVRKREPAIDFATASDSGLKAIADRLVLQRAALGGRALVSHDRNTMIREFRQYIVSTPSPGLVIVAQSAPIGGVVEALVTIWSASDESDWVNRILYVPSLVVHVFT